ncbi:MAG: STAS domain-containing protein [Pseudomonadota bacterium]
MSLTIHRTQQNGSQIVRAEGRVDSSNAAEFEAAALAALEDGGGALVFDLGELVYMSSAGLRVLLVALKASKAKGAPVGLAGVQENVATVLKISGFGAMFTVADDVDQTLAAIG